MSDDLPGVLVGMFGGVCALALVILWTRLPPDVFVRALCWWRACRAGRVTASSPRPATAASSPRSPFEHRLAVAGIGFTAFEPRQERTIEFVADRTFSPRLLSVPAPLSDSFCVLDVAIAGQSMQGRGGLMIAMAVGGVGYYGDFPDVHAGDRVTVTVINHRPCRAYFCAILVGIDDPGVAAAAEERWALEALRRALAYPHAGRGAGLVPRGLWAAKPPTREDPLGGPVSEASERGDEDEDAPPASHWRH